MSYDTVCNYMRDFQGQTVWYVIDPTLRGVAYINGMKRSNGFVLFRDEESAKEYRDYVIDQGIAAEVRCAEMPVIDDGPDDNGPDSNIPRTP